MIFRFDARATGAIRYGPMVSAGIPHISPQHAISNHFEEIHVERSA
ncbi:MAG TPA: hypothetical protein VNH65_01675 [Candidatus Acidoferrum sp.]|nr:hypothetical protein [Candidatus Acidoferrum sp.]